LRQIVYIAKLCHFSPKQCTLVRNIWRSSNQKAFFLLEFAVSAILSLTILALLAPSIKAGHNFLLSSYEESHRQYKNAKLEALLTKLVRGSEKVAGFKQVYQKDSGTLLLLLTESKTFGRRDGECFTFTRSSSSIRGTLAITASGYRALKLNRNNRNNRRVCKGDLSDEILLEDLSPVTNSEPILALVGLKDIITLSASPEGELRYRSLLSGINQKIISNLEYFELEEKPEENILVTWKLKNEVEVTLTFSTAIMRGSYLEWVSQ